MKNVDLAKLLRIRAHTPRARLPEKIFFDLDVNQKHLTLKLSKECLGKNMQDNAGAFESWALVLKYYLSDMIDTVTIDWEDIKEEDKDPHFNRFVYRLDKFLKTYGWVQTYKELPDIPAILRCNCPIVREAASEEKFKENSEGKLESEYVKSNSANYDYMNHQFPVGLFDEKKSKTTRYTPGNKSAIDIWAIKEKQFFIFELKKDDNKPLGIISEILFYTNVIIDLFHEKILFEKKGNEFSNALDNNARGFRYFYDYLKNVNPKTVTPILLANNIHPIISTELLEFVNDSPRWRELSVCFSKQTLNK